MNSAIEIIHSREILDSRGNPTVEVDIKLRNGSRGRAAVPSGASTGKHEAIELRDGNKKRYQGKGVCKAVTNINTVIADTLKGFDATNQLQIDNIMIELDGTKSKSKLGANALLGVSIAVSRAAANYYGMPLFKYLGGENAVLLPVPMMNILNGGSHANNTVDIQEFMVFPFGAYTFSQALRMGVEVFHHLKLILQSRKMSTAIGDEGGFAPDLTSNEEALDIILEAIQNTRYKAGKDIFIALDIAATELYKDGKYQLKSEGKSFSSRDMVAYLNEFVEKYPIISIEDGLSEDDWDGWSNLTSTLGKKIQIVGDDLTVTNKSRLRRSIDEKCMNAILIKLNQIGTITETIEAVKLAKNSDFGAIISHRSGETEDTTIADFSVAMGMGQIKTGSASRTDRICKYNQLLRIEEQLGNKAVLADMGVLGTSRQ